MVAQSRILNDHFYIIWKCHWTGKIINLSWINLQLISPLPLLQVNQISSKSLMIGWGFAKNIIGPLDIIGMTELHSHPNASPWAHPEPKLTPEIQFWWVRYHTFWEKLLWIQAFFIPPWLNFWIHSILDSSRKYLSTTPA